jgi:molybdopterin synthase sulfur carrier subunit
MGEMSVNVELSGVLSQVSGEEHLEVSSFTIAEVLENLVIRFGDDFRYRLFDSAGKPRRFINIYVNGRDYRFLKRLDTELMAGDTVTIIPAVSGG